MGVFEQACIMSNESFLKTIPDVLPEPQYSRKHIRKINRLINKMRNDRYHRLTTGTVKVLVVAAIILSLALSAFAIPSVREYVITQFKTHSVFRAVSTEDSKPVTELTVGYIPEGFELVEENVSQTILKKMYVNKNNEWIMVSKMMVGSDVGIDTETSNIEVMVLSGIEYNFYKGSNGTNGVVWSDNKFTYFIDGLITQEEMLNIAKFIE